MCPVSLSYSLHIYRCICIATYHVYPSPLYSFVSCVLQAEAEPISIYHPTTKEISTTMGTPMEGFFDGVDVVAVAMAFATPAAA